MSNYSKEDNAGVAVKQTGKQQYPNVVTALVPIPVGIGFSYMLVSFLVVNISCKVRPNSIMFPLHDQISF